MKSITSSLLLIAVLMGSLTSTRAFADQPHMMLALERLYAAKAELLKAEANKGGYRDRAIESLNRAISEVKNGIAYRRTH